MEIKTQRNTILTHRLCLLLVKYKKKLGICLINKFYLWHLYLTLNDIVNYKTKV